MKKAFIASVIPNLLFMPKPKPQPSSHSEHLDAYLNKFQRALWIIKLSEALLSALIGVLAIFLFVFLLDRLFDTPSLLRFFFFLAGLCCLGGFLPYCLYRWVFSYRRQKQIARLVTRRYPSFGDSLLGIIELKESSERQSSQLIQAAIKKISDQALHCDLSDALPKSYRYQSLLALIVLSSLVIAIFTLIPQASRNALLRWSNPFGGISRYTFTQLDITRIPHPLLVAHGEPFSLSIPLHQHTARYPKTASLIGSFFSKKQSVFHQGKYTFSLPGATQPTQLVIEAGDTKALIPIQPISRPALEKIALQISFPQYLGYPDYVEPINNQSIAFLRGSSLRIATQSTTPLASLQASITPLLKNKKNAKPTEPLPFSLLEKTALSAPFSPKENSELILLLKDKHGFDGDAPLHLKVTIHDDQAPVCFIQNLSNKHSVLAKQTIAIHLSSHDDYGLQAMGVDFFDKNNQLITSLQLAKGKPMLKNLDKPWTFCPADMGIAPQKITLRAWSKDYRPQGKKSYAQDLVFYILTPQEHAAILKEHFMRFLGVLEDTIRDEEALQDTNKGLLKKKEKLSEQLSQQADKEQETQRQTRKLSEELGELFRESMGNPSLDKSLLKKMKNLKDLMDEVSQNPLSKAVKKLQDASQSSNTLKKTHKDLSEAIAWEQDALDKMQQALNQANQTQDAFEIATFLHRLKNASKNMHTLSFELSHHMDALIGKSLSHLEPAMERFLSKKYNHFEKNRKELSWLKEDLTHYYTRNPKKVFKQITDEMDKTAMAHSLEKLAYHLKLNHTYESLSAADNWAKQLDWWVKLLEKQSSSPPSGNLGEGNAQSSNQDQDFEFMLKVMRLVQKEQNLRSRTRALKNLRALQTPQP